MQRSTGKARIRHSWTNCAALGLAITTAAMPLLLTTGCAGFESKPIKPVDTGGQTIPVDDGIVYYMPLRPIIVQVALDDKSVMTITLPTASAIPDRSRPYLLTVPDNGIGQSHATIQVGTNGLLQSAATVQTSGVDTLVKAIATDLGSISALAARVPYHAPPVPATCEKSHTYSRVIWPEQVASGTPIAPICDLTVSLDRLGGNSPLAKTSKSEDYVTSQSGIFYRLEIPYLVTVEPPATPGLGQGFIAYSPDEAPTQFLPLKKSAFANNTTTFTLTDGLLTKAESDVGGEITGFFVLPADIISAYMAAVGSVFTSLKANDTDKTGLALSNAQLQACRAAIAGNPIQNVSASQAATNYAVIKAACGG